MRKTRRKRPRKEPEGRIYGGVRPDERRAERRARFIQAGIEVFGKEGFAAATTRTLCAEAGLTQRYFYESFDGTHGLFRSVLRVLGDRLERDVLAAIARAPANPEDQLRSALTVYYETLARDPRVARILLAEVYTAGPTTGALALEFGERLAELLRARMEAFVPQLSEMGVVPHLMASGLIGATHHIALRWWLTGFEAPVEQVVMTAYAIYFGEARA